MTKAATLFANALKHYPDFEEAQVGLSRVLIYEKKPGPAIAHLRWALTLDPEDDVAYFQLAQAYRQLGNVAEERKALAEFQHIQAGKRSVSWNLP